MTVSLKQWYFSCSQKNFQSFWWLHSTRVPLEKAMAPYSRNLAWKIPWMEEPGRLKSTGSLRVRHDWATSLSLFTFMHWRRKCNHSSVLALRIPGTGEPGGLPSMGSHRVGHDWSELAAAAAEYTNWEICMATNTELSSLHSICQILNCLEWGVKDMSKPLKYKNRQFYITFVLKRLRKLKYLCESPRSLCPSKRGELEIQCMLPKPKESVFYWMELITLNCIRKITEASLIWEIL